MKRQKFKLNIGLRGRPACSIIGLDIDKSGRPIDYYWGRRWDDAQKDKCMERYVEPLKETKQAKKVEAKK